MKYYKFLSQEERENWEERSAIIEYDGNISKEEAEEIAYNIIVADRKQLSFDFN